MPELPQSLGLKAELLPVRLIPADAARLERVTFQPQFGVEVATSQYDPSGGRYLIEFEFETSDRHYELWIEYAAEDSRPIRVALDGQVLFDGAAGVTGGWGESAQAWHYEATLTFSAGPHRLALSRIGYIPHIRTVALVPVSVPAHEPTVPPCQRTDPVQRSRRPERTLVCILAQTRAHMLTWTSFKRNVLDALHADLALAIGMDERYDYANPFWQHAQYRWGAPEYEDFGDGFDEAQHWRASEADVVTQPWRHILESGGNWLGRIKGPQQQKGAGGALLYFRWFLRHQIVRNGLLDRYDRFIITRSDFVWVCPHPPLSVLAPEAIWFPCGEFYGGLTDRHVVVSRPDLLEIIGLLDDIVLRPDDLIARLGHLPSHFNIEMYIHFHLRARGLLARTKLFPYVMYAVRGDGDPTSWAQGVWNDEVGALVKYPSEYEAALIWRERLLTRQDWERLLEERPDLLPPAM